MKSVRLYLLIGGLAAVAACVPRAETPPPPPAPAPAPPPPAPPPPAADWRDVPLTPGDWNYRGDGGSTGALFGPANGEAHFTVRCDRARRQILLSRAGRSDATAMTIRTSFGARAFPVTAETAPLPHVSTTVPASDRFLDSMVFSRGRFTVELAGAPMLVIPAWPEPARVIEDCRS